MVVVQVIDDVGVGVCTAAGVGLFADFLIEAGMEKTGSDPGQLLRGAFGSHGDVIVVASGLGKSSHDGNDTDGK